MRETCFPLDLTFLTFVFWMDRVSEDFAGLGGEKQVSTFAL